MPDANDSYLNATTAKTFKRKRAVKKPRLIPNPKVN